MQVRNNEQKDVKPNENTEERLSQEGSGTSETVKVNGKRIQVKSEAPTKEKPVERNGADARSGPTAGKIQQE